jgi:hypothetical protein
MKIVLINAPPAAPMTGTAEAVTFCDTVTPNLEAMVAINLTNAGLLPPQSPSQRYTSPLLILAWSAVPSRHSIHFPRNCLSRSCHPKQKSSDMPVSSLLGEHPQSLLAMSAMERNIMRVVAGNSIAKAGSPNAPPIPPEAATRNLWMVSLDIFFSLRSMVLTAILSA